MNNSLAKKDVAVVSHLPKNPVQKILARLAEKGITVDKHNIFLEINGEKQAICEKFIVGGIARKSCGARLGIACRLLDKKQGKKYFIIPFDVFGDMHRLAVLLQKQGLSPSMETYCRKAVATYIDEFGRRGTIAIFDKEGIEWLQDDQKKHPIAIIGERIIYDEQLKLKPVVLLKQASIYANQGSIKDWGIGARQILAGNPYLIVMVCASLSAPFKALFNLDLLSLLISAMSSTGKTTILRFLKSLFGPPDEPNGWSSTANAIEALAIRHRDAPLILDELGESAAADTLNVIYRASNGTQKARAKSDGTLQDIEEIRSLIFSGGEITLREHAKSGRQRLRNGHDVRMPTLQPKEEFGCFSSLNGAATAAEFAGKMDQLGQDCYGVVFPAFVEKLILRFPKIEKSMAGWRDNYAKKIISKDGFETLSPIEQRVLRGFAAGALAGEMAIHYKILPLKKGDAVDAVRYIYAEWLRNWRSEGGAPQEAILSHFRDFFKRQAASAFEEIRDWASPRRGAVAGYTVCHKKHGGLYLVHQGYFEKELSADYRLDDALSALRVAGFLVEHVGGRTFLQRMPRRDGDSDAKFMRFYAIKESVRFDQ